MTLTLDWDQIGSDGSQTLSDNGQDVTVSVSTPLNGEHKEWFVENGMLKNWDVTHDSSADISFNQEVENVKFTLLDVDRIDEITIMTKDADGNPVPVEFEVTGVHEVNGSTVTGTQTNADGPGDANSGQDIEVCIPGPVMTFWIVLDDGPERSYSGTVAVSDIEFDITPVLDGTVEGTSGDDVIDVAYAGDPDGDFVDNNDAILPGDTGNDDLIFGYEGDDSIEAGDGDDEVYGGSGNDEIDGGTGDDLIFGDNGGASSADSFTGPRESFNWQHVTGHQSDTTVTQDTGNVDVTYTRIADTGHHESASDDHTHLNVDGIDAGGEAIDTDSSLSSITNGQGNIGAFQWDFSEPVGNLEFNINDLDGDGLVTIRAYDADGNEIPVTLVGGSDIEINGNVADAVGPYQDPNDPDTTVQVTVAGPVSRVVLEHTQDGSDNSGINITDMFFDTGFVEGGGDGGEDGDDVISGGEGNDVIFGEGGDDIIEGGDGNDSIEGGAGDDVIEGNDGNDVIYGDNGGGAPGAVGRESFDWQGLNDDDVDSTVVKDTGTVTVTYTRTEDTGNHFSQVSDDDLNTDGIDTGDGTVDPNTSLLSETSGQGNVGEFCWDFSDPVNNVSFNINDIDGDGVVTVTAFDADGNPIEVILTGGDQLTLLDTDTVAGVDTADSEGGYAETNSPLYNLNVSIPGPVSKVVVNHTQDGGDNSGIRITEIFFDSNEEPVSDEGGNDDLFGGAGEDVIYGQQGDDTLDGGAGADTLFGGDDNDIIRGGGGDVVDGGAGGDDFDVLDITGQGPYILTGPDGTGDPIPDSNGNGLDGQVVFVDSDGNPTGEVIDFTEIEEIIGDPTNLDPNATSDDYDAGEDDPSDVIGNVLDNDDDPNGDDLSVGAVDGDPANVGQPVAGDNGGLITIAEDGTVTFDPNDDFEELGEGEETTTTVTYTVDDGNGGTDTTTVTITVTGTNDGPVAEDDTATTDEDTVIPLDNVLDNDDDAEGDPLTVTEVDGQPAGTPVAGDNGGLITINPDGTASFDPNGEFDDLAPGETATTEVTYTVDDGNGGTDTATVTVTVTGTNDAPIATADDLTAGEDDAPADLGNVLDNDEDPDGDPLTVTDVDGVPAGTPAPGDNGGLITIDPDGTVSFDPNGDFDDLAEGETATTTVTYTVDDGNGGTDTETVTITVTGTNDAPVATNDSGTTDQDTAIPLDNVLDNDDDAEGDPLTVTEVDGQPAGTPVAGDNGGLITINPDGTASFDPNGEFDDLAPGETATTEVTYTVDDGNGGTDTATVTVTVTGTNDEPVATNDDFVTDEDTTGVVGNALDNDEDPDGDDLIVGTVDGDSANVGAPVPGDNGGLITIAEDGTVTFDPNGEFDALEPGETAETSITYTIDDGNGGTDTATVTITVNGVNDDPDAVDNGYTVAFTEGAGDVDGNVLTDDTGDGVDSDPEDDTLTVVGVGSPNAGVGTAVAGSAGGLFTILADGTVDFDANGEFEGLGLGETATTEVEYTISDGNGGFDTAVASFTVTGVNDGTVSGTDGADIINPGYVDDDGDIADGNDAILPGDTGNDDLIEGNGGDDIINAGDGNDEVYGGDDDDLINGNAGNDTLFGDDGDDTVNGGLGNDTVFGGLGDDNLNGQDGVDRIEGGDGNDDIDGGAGNDRLFGGEGDDNIEGSEGEDTIDGGAGDDDIWGGLDDDTITGGEGSDTVGGGAGNDVINTGNHVDPAADYDYPGPSIPGLPIGDDDPDPTNDLDTVFGGAGDDIITTGDDDDSVDGGTGNDFIDVGIDDDTVDAGEGNDTVIGSQGEDFIEGGAGDDVLYGGLEDEVLDLPDAIDPAPDDNRDTIYGGDGNDTIYGRDDDDTLFGDDGEDEIYGGIDDDVINGGGDDDLIFGDEGNDSITGEEGDDTVFGGIGDDFVTGGITGNDEVHGDDGNDTVQGGTGDDTLFGGDGNDTLSADLGDDTLFGEDGDDSIQAGAGDDTVFGGAGDDVIRGNVGSDSIDGGDGDDFIEAGDNPRGEFPDQDYPGDGLPADPDPFDDIDVVDGGAGNDFIRTGDDADTIFGGTGDDVIDAGIDNDQITGGEGADQIDAGLGSDTIFGGTAGDVVVGGEDPDDSDIDVLDLTGSNVDRIEYVDGDPEAGTVFFNDGSTMTFSEIENVIPCFTPGTTIATPRGERRVEELQVGDKIITRDNGIQEIAWLGHKQMDGKQLASNPHLKPILIKAGSLGHGLPERDMLVSPNHRVLVASELTQLYFEESEVLAAAKHMTGADGIHAVDVMATTYVHFMFERHEVVLSNGAWTESFQPGDYSLKGIGNGQRNEIFELFPELATKTGLEGYQSARKALKKHEARLLMK